MKQIRTLFKMSNTTGKMTDCSKTVVRKEVKLGVDILDPTCVSDNTTTASTVDPVSRMPPKLAVVTPLVKTGFVRRTGTISLGFVRFREKRITIRCGWWW